MKRGKRIIVFQLKAIFFLFFNVLNLSIIALIPISSAYLLERPCRSTSNCNPTDDTNFICWNAICVCDLSRQLVYDHSENYCLRPPGGKCKSNNDCVLNAHCDSKTELCVCSPPHFEETINGECRAKYKCPCNDTVLCNETKLLQCTDGQCSCATTGHNLFYDRKKDKCVAELGEKCELNEWMDIQIECESNAECLVNEEDKDKFYGVCHCKKNYYAPFYNCERDIGSPCNETDESSCQDGLHLKCHRGQCQCVDDAVFDSNYNQCRLKIGSKCHPSLNHCVYNAKCSEKYINEAATCECEDGYAKTSKGSCKADYGNYCKVDNDCLGEGSRLSCSEGTCKCQLGQEYNSQMRSCVSIIGEPCNSHVAHLNNVVKVHCVQNALCIPDENDIGRCTCKPLFVQQKNSCVPGIGAPCITSPDCPEQLGFICSGEMCICNNKTIFDSVTKKCKLKSGETCQQNGEMECASNSYCDSYESDSHSTNNRCICSEGFESTPDGQCLPGYGQPCNQFAAICNDNRAYTCINNICGCESPLIFNDKLKYCEIVQGLSSSLSSSASQVFSVSLYYLIWFILSLRIILYM